MESYVQMPQLDAISENGLTNLRRMIPGFNFSDFVSDIAEGKNIFKADNIFESILSVFANEMYSAIKILTVIIGIVMISALLENLRHAFNKESSLNTSVVIIALSAGLAGKIFSQTSTYAGEICSDITNCMWAILPVMGTLLAGSGFVSSFTITNPTLYFMCNVFAQIFNKVLIPLSVVYLAVSLADLITDAVKLEKFRELLKKMYNFILGFMMTLFTGLLGISSFAGVSMDSVGAKGVKFALSNMVPFVGRSLSDAMSAVASASLLLKNAVGITGIICMLAICIIPVIKTAVTIIAIRLSAAICEPIASEKTVQILSAVADSLSMINAALIATGMMMIISLSIIVGIK